MDNNVFLDGEKKENKPLVTHHDQDRDDNNDYDNYNTPDTSSVTETTLIPGSMDKQVTPNLRLKQKVEHDKLAALYNELNVTGDLDLIDLK